MRDQLIAEKISAKLSRSLAVEVLESVDSTNTEAKRRISAGLNHPLLLLAQEQTAGRGRLGRSFCSPRGAGLYMSLVLHPNLPAKEVLSVTSAAAVAVCLAIESLIEKKPQIKWVNDVYLDDKKLCGILTEAVTDPASGRIKSLVVGIGLNVFPSAFPAELDGLVTALFGAGEATVSRNRLAAELVNRLLALYEELPSKTWLPLYRERAWLDGKAVVWRQNGALYEGVVGGIDEDGSLRIATENGEKVLSTGEVSIRPKERFRQ